MNARRSSSTARLRFHAANATQLGQDATRLTRRVRARRRQTRNRLTPFGPQPGGLTRPQGNRGHKFMRAFVARPGVADAASQVECGFFSDQQNAAAARAFRSAKIVGGGLRSIAGELQGHRRSSATLPHAPRLSRCCYHARPLWRCHDAIMKLSWPVGATFGRNDNGRGRICIKTAVGARVLVRRGDFRVRRLGAS